MRTLHCIAGINITASHNPPEYNGYKVYWEDGAQITPPHDTGIMAEVKKVTDFNTVLTMDKEEAVKAGLYQVIGKEIDDTYIEALKSQVIHWDAIKEAAGDLKIVYTPLHGTGNIPARRVLKEIGFEHVYVVKEQELPDGEFPTVSYPNRRRRRRSPSDLPRERDRRGPGAGYGSRRGPSWRACKGQGRCVPYPDRKYVRLSAGGV